MGASFPGNPKRARSVLYERSRSLRLGLDGLDLWIIAAIRALTVSNFICRVKRLILNSFSLLYIVSYINCSLR